MAFLTTPHDTNSVTWRSQEETDAHRHAHGQSSSRRGGRDGVGSFAVVDNDDDDEYEYDDDHSDDDGDGGDGVVEDGGGGGGGGGRPRSDWALAQVDVMAVSWWFLAMSW